MNKPLNLLKKAISQVLEAREAVGQARYALKVGDCEQEEYEALLAAYKEGEKILAVLLVEMDHINRAVREKAQSISLGLMSEALLDKDNAAKFKAEIRAASELDVIIRLLQDEPEEITEDKNGTPTDERQPDSA